MTDTKNKPKSGFRRGLAVYTLVLLALIAVGLIVFYFYIAAYEYSRPEGTMSRYLAAMDDAAYQQRVTDFVSTLDHRVQSEEESLQRIQEALSQVSYAKKVSESTDTRLVYVLKSGKTLLGQVTLVPSEKKRLGFSTWEVSEDALDLDVLCNQTEMTVPAGYQVRCGDFILDESCITDDQVHYDLLEEFYGSYTLPTKITYRSGLYVGEAETAILDPSGNPVTEDMLEEAIITDNCTDMEKAAIRELTELYIERYVTYLSGYNRAHTPNLYAVLVLTVRDSDLYSRLYQALGGQGFASSHGDYIQSITINHMMKVSDEMYLVDATYLVDTYGQNYTFTTTTNNTKLLLVQTMDGLRAIAQASY